MSIVGVATLSLAPARSQSWYSIVGSCSRRMRMSIVGVVTLSLAPARPDERADDGNRDPAW